MNVDELKEILNSKEGDKKVYILSTNGKDLLEIFGVFDKSGAIAIVAAPF